MPIYEFYCDDCHVIFQFLSRTVNTKKRPKCPRCQQKKLKKEVSRFAVTGRAKEEGGVEDLPFDESKMEQAMTALAGEAENINEDDPRQAAKLMRKMSEMTGMELGESMQEAIRRMEAGEDPETIEKEMGDLLEQEDPFLLQKKKGGGAHSSARRAPARDETLYEM